MFIEKIKSEGLAHLSYLVGDGDEAAVIDPRRDGEVYLEMAQARGCRIAHVIETHCNEDLVSGAPMLAEMTGAEVWHGPNADSAVVYARTVREGEEFRLGKLRLKVWETPGHTFDSLSISVHDDDFGDAAVGVFTGDALFIGDVGRTDFYPDRAREVAGLLYDSLQKILDLGDQALIYPAHGAGSVCGAGMADREFSSIGYERAHNPALQHPDRASFVEAKLAEHHEKPPYFARMEEMNTAGAGPAPRVPTPRPLSAAAFEARDGNAVLVDVRGVAAYLGAHVPGSLALPADMIPSFAGWYLGYDDGLVLVADDAAQAETAARHLARIGYDRVSGFVTTAMPAWAAGGRGFATMPVVTADEVAMRREMAPEDWTILDVRGQGEVDAAGLIEGSTHVYVGEVPAKLDALDPSAHYTVMCASGARATIAASALKRAGFQRVDVFLGSMGAWLKHGGDTVAAAKAAE